MLEFCLSFCTIAQILCARFRYHKTKLYFEDQFDSPSPPEYSVFETDFGVRFGQFICYDIIFYDPAVELIAHGLKNIIYTSAWVDELPFLMGKELITNSERDPLAVLMCIYHSNPVTRIMGVLCPSKSAGFWLPSAS